jgi:hypothetical protein
MSNYDNNNQGALFKNDKEGNPKWPDYTGQCEVDGIEYWLSCWVKESKGGKKYMSLSFTPKDKEREEKPAPQGGDPGEIPF